MQEEHVNVTEMKIITERLEKRMPECYLKVFYLQGDGEEWQLYFTCV